MVRLAPTEKDELLRDGSARIYRFRASPESPNPARTGATPVLLVPSLINRWYVLDLRAGASLAAALVESGHDTWCLDWGIPQDEDRYLSWDDVVARLARAVRFVRRETGTAQVSLLGYCMGGTLSAIHTALEPESIAALVNLAGPIDFSHAGVLGRMTDARWFDAGAIADAGNVLPAMMQSGFTNLRPTAQLAKWVSFLDRGHDEASRDAFFALEAWASDNIPFPGEAYRRYVGDLYQQNQLVKGTHRVRGRRVDLASIDCPVLTVVTERDVICPPPAARALNECCGAADEEVFAVPGGHVGAVVGGRAASVLYPKISAWLHAHAA